MERIINTFFEKHNYPEDAIKAVKDVYGILKDNEEFLFLVKNFYEDETINVDRNGSELDNLCQNLSISFYTAKLLYYICLNEELAKQYKNAGISEEMYDEAIDDIHCKMMECYNVYKEWGIFSEGWFVSVYRLKTFSLGRFMYNEGIYDGKDFTVGGRKVTKGDKYISIHIPSSGKPFTTDARMDSYARAYEFYKERFGQEPLFRCETWLINPALRNLLNEKSNIVSFMNDFKIVGSYLYEDNRYLWRVFGADYLKEPKDLPRDNSLRKVYADYLTEGNRPGAGIGFFVFDPVNKTTLK